MNAPDTNLVNTGSTRDDSLRAEVQKLGEQLSDRLSVLWFARAFALAFFGFIMSGVSVRLFIDSIRLPHFFWPLAVVGGAALLGACFAGLRGVGELRRERAEFRRFQEMRARLGLD